MIYLSGKVVDGIPAMLTPAIRRFPPADVPWAADNGRFGDPASYSDEAYLRWLARRAPDVDRCLFATAPDVVGDAAATLALSGPMYDRIRLLAYPVALVAQDGLEELPVPWDAFDALFVGGSTEWKLSEAAFELGREAKALGKWTHVGRVSSWRRFRAFAAAGFDSADGTTLAFDPARDVAGWSRRAVAAPGLGL